MSQFPDHAQFANLDLIEKLYMEYLDDPQSVDVSWRHFFEGIDFGTYLYKRGEEPKEDTNAVRIRDLIDAYRKYGHLKAKTNPLEQTNKTPKELELEALGFFSSELKEEFPSFGLCPSEKAPLEEIISSLEQIYCGSIGFEYMGIEDVELQNWIQSRIEPKLLLNLSVEEKHLILEFLNRSELLETFLHTKYVGQTRFSLEGAETLIPILAEMIDLGIDLGIETFFIAMPHRGRLNVLINILEKPIASLLEEFEDDTTLSIHGNNDVKYHMGYTGKWKSKSGKEGKVEMAANPSHLEAVDPVILGQAYAKQKGDQNRVVPLVIHGDASIAGQGVVYESMQLMNLPNYSVGGSIHIVINNQIGYTTVSHETRSTRYCTDIAKAFNCPVFHVNAEDPQSCIFVSKLAMEIRQKFRTDVFIDLICYRKYGHNEGDEPSFTQPLEYKIIREKKSIRDLYLEELEKAGATEKKMAETLEKRYQETLKSAIEELKNKQEQKKSPPVEQKEKSIKTGVSKEVLEEVAKIYCHLPEGFTPHPKLQKWLEQRLLSMQSKISWATAEMLAIGSLLKEGISVRLAGQDVQRGTFSQRHLIWTDAQTGKKFCPLCSLKGDLHVVNSPLTENAGMGFEFGYNTVDLDSLVLWEAQYGDFFNGAQTIVDQFLVCSEVKWNMRSSLTLLLPHGHEGAGPEHSSARIERFLQLAAGQNIRVANPSTPAQYFHLLRRQALSDVKKPLIAFTPKSLLRKESCTSSLQELQEGMFYPILKDVEEIKSCKKLILCSGKIFYNLIDLRKSKEVAVIRIDELYPLDVEALKGVISQYSGFKSVIWLQEEPENMGAWPYLAPFLKEVLPQITYLGREASATTATGSNKKHKQEQQELLNKALEER